MAQIIWTEPALNDLDAIADYIALDKPLSAQRFVQKVFKKVELLKRYPNLGTMAPKLRTMSYRQLVIPPCRIFYRRQKDKVFIVFVMRAERRFSEEILTKRDRFLPH